MERGKIIVVEGPSNSGKTTTCKNMKKYSNCEVIEECMIYEKNPPRPSQNYEQEISNQVSIACGKEMHIKYIDTKPQDTNEMSEEEELTKFANQFDIPFDVIE